MSMKPAYFFALLATLATQPGSAAGREWEWPTSPDQFHVSLEVVQALEDGPLVCKLHITNVSNTRFCWPGSKSHDDLFCTVDAWKPKKELALVGFRSSIECGPLFTRDYRPGATDSEVLYVHKDFLTLTPGKHTARFGCKVYRPSTGRRLDPLVIAGTGQIEVLPATAQNVASALHYMEQEFAEILPQLRDEDDSEARLSAEVARPFVDTLAGTRHPEFVPLLLKAVDALPREDFKSELIWTINESFPSSRGGFEVLVGYLSSAYPVAACDVFDEWIRHEAACRVAADLQQDLKKLKSPVQKAQNSDGVGQWEYLAHELDAWRSSARHVDRRLTEREFARLRAIPNLYVRMLLYAHYPEECPDAWTEKLFSDVRKYLEEPPRLDKLLTQLNDEQFTVRQQAARELLQLSPVWAPLLRDLGKKSASAEVARRLGFIADKLDDPQRFRLERRTVHHLVCCPRRQGWDLAKILLNAKQPNKLTETAQARFPK